MGNWMDLFFQNISLFVARALHGREYSRRRQIFDGRGGHKGSVEFLELRDCTYKVVDSERRKYAAFTSLFHHILFGFFSPTFTKPHTSLALSTIAHFTCSHICYTLLSPSNSTTLLPLSFSPELQRHQLCQLFFPSSIHPFRCTIYIHSLCCPCRSRTYSFLHQLLHWGHTLPPHKL